MYFNSMSDDNCDEYLNQIQYQHFNSCETIVPLGSNNCKYISLYN